MPNDRGIGLSLSLTCLDGIRPCDASLTMQLWPAEVPTTFLRPLEVPMTVMWPAEVPTTVVRPPVEAPTTIVRPRPPVGFPTT